MRLSHKVGKEISVRTIDAMAAPPSLLLETKLYEQKIQAKKAEMISWIKY